MKKGWLLLFNIIYVIFFTLNSHPDLIESCKIINKNKIVVKANQSFSRQFIKEDFFAEYDASIDLTKLNESIVTIPFILSVTPVVWFSNEIYSIDVMDKNLYHSLQKIREVFRMFYPRHSWSGELVPKKLVTNTIGSSNRSDQPDLALLFSGGLDSVNTSISHVDTKQLLITAWGADVKVGAKNQWDRVLEQCRKFAQTYGHDHTFVKSNFREFTETSYLYNKFPRWWVRVPTALSLVGLTVPLLVQHNISMLFIAATYTIEHPYPLGSHPAVDNNISFAGSSVCSTGLDKNRTQKIMNISVICKEKKLPLPTLRPCWSDPLGKNCLACEKCMNTYINIIAAGQEPCEYGFNVDTNNAIQKMREILFVETKYLSSGEIHLWKSTVSHLDALAEHKICSILPQKDIEELRNFLCSINFEWYRNPRTHLCSSQERALFAKLWEQNIKEVKI